MPSHFSLSGKAELKTVSNFSTITAGTKNVTTAGTRLTLVATSAPAKHVFIQAKRANTGFIYVGGVTIASTNGISLSAGDVIDFPITDLIAVYLDSSVNGEGVTFSYFT